MSEEKTNVRRVNEQEKQSLAKEQEAHKRLRTVIGHARNALALIGLDDPPRFYLRPALATLLLPPWQAAVCVRFWPDDPPPTMPRADDLPDHATAERALDSLNDWSWRTIERLILVVERHVHPDDARRLAAARQKLIKAIENERLILDAFRKQAPKDFDFSGHIPDLWELWRAEVGTLKAAPELPKATNYPEAAAALDVFQHAVEKLAESSPCGPPPVESMATATDLPPFASAKDLATLIGKPSNASAVESFLRRYRDKYPDCYTENESPRKNDPKYLYRVADVLPVLKEHFTK
jgi:hypothetical protein